MDTPLMDWTIERVTQVAPNEKIAESGRRLSDPQNAAWKLLGRGELCAWGEYQGNADEVYICKIDLLKLQQGDHHWDCTCEARKTPCKHILALLYRLLENPTTIAEGIVPDYVLTWRDNVTRNQLEKMAQKNEGFFSNLGQDDERAEQYQARRQRIMAGLIELEQWLFNLIRHGLAEAQVQTYEFWDARAARLVDAQATGVANWLRDMGGIPVSGDDWIEPLMDQLGRLYLLIQSYKRFDSLPITTQSDIRTVLGWPVKRHEVRADDGIVDDWLVLGRDTDSEKNKASRIWLRGRESGRDVLIQELRGDILFESHLQIGWSLQAKMVYYPSRSPLRAFIAEKLSDVVEGVALTGQNIQTCIENYSQSLAQNPWLAHYPFLLDQVVTLPYGKGWVLREENGDYLPISERFRSKYWVLMALSGGRPIQVAGEWNGEKFYPTGASVDNRFIDFADIGKI